MSGRAAEPRRCIVDEGRAAFDAWCYGIGMDKDGPYAVVEHSYSGGILIVRLLTTQLKFAEKRQW